MSLRRHLDMDLQKDLLQKNLLVAQSLTMHLAHLDPLAADANAAGW